MSYDICSKIFLLNRNSTRPIPITGIIFKLQGNYRARSLPEPIPDSTAEVIKNRLFCQERAAWRLNHELSFEKADMYTATTVIIDAGSSQMIKETFNLFFNDTSTN